MTLNLINSVSFSSSAVIPQHVSRSYEGPKMNCVAPASGLPFRSRRVVKDIRYGRLFFAADSNRVATDSTETDSVNAEKAPMDDRLSTAKPTPLSSAAINTQPDTSDGVESVPQMGEAADGLRLASEAKQDKISSSNMQSMMPKRSSLTAREKLRAARVLSRYTESKTPKAEMGSNVLDALRESDGGKARSGLPEAPTNLFDDSKRGMPKKGLTFDLPGGVDLYVIIFSIVFISTVMFGTTYIVWKVGAIHFNEY
eukprot:TRINITY_DN7366_c0_g1_i1.p1 TRINITY_DN7366_c0_g1~~TRINITY_DN7366_c0_g1_i1.p1  ORF type:complete len:255 (+),score=37.05 TRINITY_DN7366_c0_g1_i1:103-867(+)